MEALQQAYGRAVVADKAESILAAIANILVRDLGVRRLIIAGGETSGSVVQALGIERIAMGPYHGLGLCRGVVNLPEPVALMLKSGKLGNPNDFSEVLEDMRGPISIEPHLDSWPPIRRVTDPSKDHPPAAAT
ncbi:nucleotide-binding domain containing protein [Mesorhizobium sp. ORM6]